MSTLSPPQIPAVIDSSVKEFTYDLEIPSLDNRSYRFVRLPNQLEVFLVHDVETDKASAAMDVNVGYLSDENDFPGMAHAVENVPLPYTLELRANTCADICYSWERRRYANILQFLN